MASQLSEGASPNPPASPGPNDSVLPTVAKWGEATLQLKELVSQPIPNLIKVTKGQYRNIGVAKSVQSDLYLHSVKTTRKVLAEGVKVKDNKRLLQTDQRFSMPVTYQGWFEILSEDGKAIKALHTVMELARLFPQSCLVRDNIKAFVPWENGELGLDRTRTVQAGELLTLAGEINIPMSGGKQKDTVKRLLKCFDASGDSIYLGFDQKGMFSPVAGQANISGVHTIKSLIEKFRFPILVRLVHGIIPTKVEKTFTGVFRLTSVFSDETAFVCPLTKEAKMVPISTREPLKVSVATNFNKLQDMEDTKYFHQKCSHMIGSYMNSIHVLVSMPDPSLLAGGKAANVSKGASKPAQPRQARPQSAAAGNSNPNHLIAPTPDDPVEEDILFLEVEDIYAYVRQGGEPPPPRPRPEKKSDVEKATAKVMANPSKTKTGKPTAAVAPKMLSFTKSKENDNTSKGDNTSGENITWEEPIYEDIKKIRGKKKLQEIEQTIVFEGGYGPDAKEDSPAMHRSSAGQLQQNKAISPQHLASHSSPALFRNQGQQPVPTSADIPVLSLREVIKQSQGDSVAETPKTRPAAVAVNYPQEPSSPGVHSQAGHTEGDGPPIPPKKFSSGDIDVAGSSPPVPKPPPNLLKIPDPPQPPPIPNSLSSGHVKVSIHDNGPKAKTPASPLNGQVVNSPMGFRPGANTTSLAPMGHRGETGPSYTTMSPMGHRSNGTKPLPNSASPMRTRGGNGTAASTGISGNTIPAPPSNTSPLNANHLVYSPHASRPKPTQLLPTAPPVQRPISASAAVQRTGPQYIAVARVGDVVHSPGTMVTTTADLAPMDTRTLNRDLSRNGRMQSTYLS